MKRGGHAVSWADEEAQRKLSRCRPLLGFWPRRHEPRSISSGQYHEPPLRTRSVTPLHLLAPSQGPRGLALWQASPHAFSQPWKQGDHQSFTHS